MRVLVVALGLSLTAAPLAVGQEAGGQDMTVENPTAQGLQDWLAGFRGRAMAAGITAETLPGITFRPDVVERDRSQDEFTKTIWDYLDKAVSDDRIGAGQKAMKTYSGLLDAIEARYQVDRKVVLAIWGLESAYGQVRGTIPVLDALATLSYDARRGEFFEGELIAALRIVQNGAVKPADFVGSWAGASGHVQFMPSSVLATAVDFAGKGNPDLWSDDPADGLASAAAYLAKAGWQMGLPWGFEVTLPQGFDVGQSGRRTQKPMSSWTALGITRADGSPLPVDGWTALLLPAGVRGPAFLVTDNFAAIEAYNKADSYVIAVGHLADRIGGAAAFRHPWPRDLRALTLAERQEMQSRLMAEGVYSGEADGKVGPLTLGAVKAFQQTQGMAPDSYASLDVLLALRAKQGPAVPAPTVQDQG
ncbi:MAG: lytic murein transglycosylase [Pseudorhodobacter sp.]|nr:lytic murein transglycosylase [Pseudorhodobacter sp.]